MKEPKKLLIITYYWPPAGGPGVQRWLKFVKYLPDFNVKPIVYIPENPTYPIIDNGLQSEVSEKAIILKNKIKEPYGLASFFGKNKTKKISSGIIPNQKTLLNNILGVRSYPTTFIVDQKGIIKQMIEGVNLDDQKNPMIYSEIMDAIKLIK